MLFTYIWGEDFDFESSRTVSPHTKGWYLFSLLTRGFPVVPPYSKHYRLYSCIVFEISQS